MLANTKRRLRCKMESGPQLIQRLKMVVGKPDWWRWNMWNMQATTDESQVSLVFQEPHIVRGYRIPNRSWWYYLASLFQWHNETINVWSHLLAFCVFLFKTVQFFQSVDDWQDKPLAWGLLSFCLGAMAYSLFSAIAHLMHSRSEYHHYLFFQLDYVGIALNAHGTGLLHYYLSGTTSFYSHFGTFYILLNTINGLLVLLGNSVSKLYFRRPYPFQRRLCQLVPCIGAICFDGIPLCYRTYACLSQGTGLDRDTLAHFESIFWCFLSGAFFAFHLPEKYIPGVFDNMGQSHSLFHVIMTYCSLVQYDVSFNDYHSRPEELVRLASPTIMTTFGCQLVLLLVCIIYVCGTHGVRVSRVKDDAKWCSVTAQNNQLDKAELNGTKLKTS